MGLEPSRFHASFVIALEYNSHALKIQGLQIAYALLLGIVFVAIGMILFAMDAAGSIAMKVQTGPSVFDIKGATPGLICIVLGAILTCVAISKDVTSGFETQLVEESKASMTKGTEVKASSGTSVDTSDKATGSE